MKKFLLYAVLLLIAIILIGCGYIYKDGTAGGICVSVGASIIATELINILTEKCLGDPLNNIVHVIKKIGNKLYDSVNIMSMSKDTGLLGIWSKRAYLETKEWIELLNKSDGDINILCYAMSFLPEHPDFSKAIKEKILKGFKVRILFGSPTGNCIKARTIEEKIEGDISERINTSIKRITSISSKIEIRFFDAPLYASIFEFGSIMLVTPQLFGIRGSCAPLMLLEKKEDGLYDSYNKYYEDIWQISTPK